MTCFRAFLVILQDVCDDGNGGDATNDGDDVDYGAAAAAAAGDDVDDVNETVNDDVDDDSR